MSQDPVLYGKYQLLERLARGGMAEVFKAKSHGVEGFEKILVIKRILPELSRDPRFVDMFIDEAKIAVTLTHANIVQVFDLDRTDNTYFIAMEYVPGYDLATVLRWAHKSGRPLGQELSVYVVSELAKGLDYAHRRRDAELRPLNIVHRDVSPQNVLLSYEGEVKLTDFGIAGARTNVRALSTLPPGKFLYMAPEQARGEQVDARADLYSLGVLLYEALAGQGIREVGTPASALASAKEGRSVPSLKARPDLPEELVDIVSRATAPAPDDRYATASELYEDLIQFLYGTGRRVGAHDLARYLEGLAAEMQDGSTDQRFDPPSGLEQLFDDFTSDSGSRAGATPVAVPTGRSKSPPTPASSGAGLTPQSEWRDVSVLALCGVDRDRALDLAARFGGQPVEHDALSGVDLTLLFGVSHADGRDAHAAARCGLRLLSGEMMSNEARGFRGVVHSGRILLDAEGEPLRDRMLETLLADARGWMRRAVPGQVAASTAASKLLRGRFEIAPAQGDAARRVERERRADEGIGKFVGRREQLRAIGESLAFANQGHTCVVAVSGEAGAGKSRLLMETARRLEHAGHDVGFYLATCTPQMRSVPLSAIQELLRVVLGVEELDPEERVREKVVRLRQLGLSATQRDAVGRVLGLSVESPPSESGSALRHALTRIALKLAEDRLSVFGWDSAEFMDDVSRGEVKRLIESPFDSRVVVLLAHRPTDDSAWRGAQNFRDVPVGPLSDEEITKLIRARLVRSEVPETLVREVSIKSGGNPLYVEELLKAMRDAGALEVKEGEVVYRAKGIELPRSLRGLVASRVGRLDAAARSILQLAVTLGTHFTPELLARASEQEEPAVRAALSVLEQRGIVRQVGPSEYTFAHALVREVLYEGLPIEGRPELHGAVARAIEAMRPDQQLDDVVERLAYHYRESGDRGRAVAYLVRAADRLEAEQALDSAIDASLQAIDLVLKDPSADREQLLHLYCRIGEMAYRTRDAEGVADRLEQALELAETMGRDEYVARFSMLRGRLLTKASRFQEGRQWLERAQQVAQRCGDMRLERDVALAAAEAHARNGEYVEVIKYVEKALELARSTEDVGAQIRCLLVAAPAYAATGQKDVAMSALREVQQLMGSSPDRLTESEFHKTRALVFHQTGDKERMIESARRALDLAREYGLHYEATVNAHNLGEFYLRMGEDKRAFAALRSSYEFAMEHGFARLQWLNVCLLGFLDAMRFDSDQGIKRMQQAIDHAEQRGYTWDLIGEKYLLAMVEQKRGRRDAARAALRDVIRLADRHGHMRVCDDAEEGLRAIEEGRAIPLLR